MRMEKKNNQELLKKDKLFEDHIFEYENILQFVKSNSDPEIFDDFVKEILFMKKNSPLLPVLFGKAFVHESSLSFTHFKNYC